MDENSQKSLLFCSLLALQFGLQPIIASKFTASGVSKTSVVIATELAKIIIAAVTLLSGPRSELVRVVKSWSFSDSLRVAALPATLYAIQNLLVQYGYVFLDSMTFNLLNQTKTLSAAFWLWALLDKKQSPLQMVALLMLLLAAVILNMGGQASAAAADSASSSMYQVGLLFVGAASMLSGLSATLTQRAVSGGSGGGQRNTMVLSAEMAVYGIVILALNLVFNSDIKAGAGGGAGSLLSHWDLPTLIPVITNAFGGMVVGLVTKYAGGVVKGFALIAGILVTGLAQFLIDGKPLGSKDLLGVVLVSAAIYLHSKYPYKEPVAPADTTAKVPTKLD